MEIVRGLVAVFIHQNGAAVNELCRNVEALHGFKLCGLLVEWSLINIEVREVRSFGENIRPN